jgi:hypothetical protein
MMTRSEIAARNTRELLPSFRPLSRQERAMRAAFLRAGPLLGAVVLVAYLVASLKEGTPK